MRTPNRPAPTGASRYFTPSRIFTRRLPSALLAGLVASILGCGESGQQPRTPAAAGSLAATTQDAAPVIHGITVQDAWARLADSLGTSAAYVTLVNGNAEAVEITGAASTAAEVVEIHETSQHEGMMHMMPRASIVIAPGDSLTMVPGGIHVMLIRVNRTLRPGHKVPLVLHLANGNEIPLTARVRTP